jgi:molecular chaperone IbpA
MRGGLGLLPEQKRKYHVRAGDHAALVGAALLGILRQRRPALSDLGSLAIVALGVVVGFPLLTALALQHITSAHSIVFIGLLPLATAIFGVVRGGERPKPAFWLFSIDMLEQSGRAEPTASWPPYDIEKIGEDQYRISMAVAGFSPNEIELVQQGNTLLVAGQKLPEPEGVQVLHRGIAARAFKQSFNLADHVKVTEAKLENGLLTVELKREIPEALKPRRIEIAPGSPEALGKNPDQDNEAKQIGRTKAA